MLKEFVLYVKYPYTAGVIGVVWIGTAILIAIDPNLPIIKMVIINCVATYLIAVIGFRSGKD